MKPRPIATTFGSTVAQASALALLLAASAACTPSNPAPASPTSPASSPASSPAPTNADTAGWGTHACSVSNGASDDAARQFKIELQAPAKYTLQSGKGCAVGYGLGPDEGADGVRIVIHVIHLEDAGPEQLLKIEPDGAKQWAHKLSRGKAEDAGAGELTLQGKTVPFYRLLRFKYAPQHEVLVARAQLHGQNVVLQAVYPPGDGDALRRTVQEVASRMKITPAQ